MFLAYAAGMGMVIGVLTIAVALARDTVALRLRRALPYVNRASGALLILAGAYVVYYGGFELRVLWGGTASNPVVDTATAAQSEVARLLDLVGPEWVAGTLLLLAGLAIAATIARSRRRSSPPRRARP